VPKTNSLAYFARALMTKKKSFKKWPLGMPQAVQDPRKKAEKILVMKKNLFVTENNKNKLECLSLHSFFSLI
jgi:hypothetical protein